MWFSCLFVVSRKTFIIFDKTMIQEFNKSADTKRNIKNKVLYFFTYCVTGTGDGGHEKGRRLRPPPGADPWIAGIGIHAWYPCIRDVVREEVEQ